jgi:predicted  nucleic acid-binding Zn-ribbon protein
MKFGRAVRGIHARKPRQDLRDTETKTQRVRKTIAECNDKYRATNRDIFTATERIEELWFEIEDLLEQMERAEALRERETVCECLSDVYHKLGRIESYLPDEFK